MEPFRNLVELGRRSVDQYRGNAALGTRQANGTWSYITYAEWGQLVDRFRAGLATLGCLQPGDRVAVISGNRVEWVVGAYAVYGLGCAYVPMYEKQNQADREYIIKDSGAKVVLVADEALAELQRPLIGARGSALEHVICFEGQGDGTYAGLMAAGDGRSVECLDPEPDSLCGLIYTSGTTGLPKGVRLSHGNICSNANAVQQVFPMDASDRSLSFLPWAHSFGQTVELHCGLTYGASMAIVHDVDKLLDYLGEVRPTVLFSVPRVWGRVYDGLNKRMAAESPLGRALFQRALAVSSARRHLGEQGRSSWWLDAQHRIFDRLVFAKVRERLGGRLRYAFSGGAAISREVAVFIDNVGIQVFEGYGLSETSPIATANTPGQVRLGSVGRAIPGVEVFIEPVEGARPGEGEVLIKGPNVMLGYHNQPEQTAAVMREDGAFRSGDLGRLDDDGYLFITGRIKEQYKLANGKYVVPAPLEEQLKLSGFVDQCLVYGDNRDANVALIVPDDAALRGWAQQRGIPSTGPELLQRDDVRGLFRAEIDKQQQAVFKGFERVADFRLLAEPFCTENDQLTPTLKLKRRNVIAAHGELLDAMYAQLEAKP